MLWNWCRKSRSAIQLKRSLAGSIRTTIPAHSQSEEDDVLCEVLALGLIESPTSQTVPVAKDGRQVPISRPCPRFRDDAGTVIGVFENRP